MSFHQNAIAYNFADVKYVCGHVEQRSNANRNFFNLVFRTAMLLSLLLIPIALAQSEFRELEVKGRLNCRPHYWDERVWPFKVSLVRQRRRGAGGEAEVIE